MRNGVWGSITLYLVKGPGCGEIVNLENIFTHTKTPKKCKFFLITSEVHICPLFYILNVAFLLQSVVM